jgi:hypothetical protein
MLKNLDNIQFSEFGYIHKFIQHFLEQGFDKLSQEFIHTNIFPYPVQDGVRFPILLHFLEYTGQNLVGLLQNVMLRIVKLYRKDHQE